MAFKVQVGPAQITIHQGQTVLVTEPDRPASVDSTSVIPGLSVLGQSTPMANRGTC